MVIESIWKCSQKDDFDNDLKFIKPHEVRIHSTFADAGIAAHG